MQLRTFNLRKKRYTLRASIIAKHSAVKEDEKGGRLFVNEMCNLGI